MTQISQVFESLWRLVVDLGTLAVDLLQLVGAWWLLIAWLAWWLLAANWHRIWPVLGRGAWAPLVLLLVVSALVWSRIAPSQCNCLGFPVANFWWQLGAVGLLACVTFFCGWLQGILGWTPPEINLEPPAHAEHGHGHGHGDAHGHAHAAQQPDVQHAHH